MYRVTSKLTSGQNTIINTVNVWNESVNNNDSKIKIGNRDTQLLSN